MGIMADSGRQKRYSVIERAIKAIRFIELHRTWTIADLSEELEINKKNGRQYLTALSLYLPIAQLKPQRHGPDGFMPAIYSLQKMK